MGIPIFSILLASITTSISIYLLRPLAISINLVDSPNIRKTHIGSVPLIGGVAMYIGLVISILVSSNDLNQFNFFLLATLIIVLAGVLDDFHNISVKLRLCLHLIVAIIIVSLDGTIIESFGNLFGNGEININKWSFIISILAIIAGMNALNMSDGIHGLAGGLSLITFLSILFLSMGSADQGNVFIVFIFCSVLPIFLVHNLCIGVNKSKRIFMGDAGSMLVGLVIAKLLIGLSQGESPAFSPVTALWIFSVPLVELVTAIFRRIMSGNSPFKGDLFHSHHLLIRLGLGEKTTLIVIMSFSLLMAVIGILSEIYGVPEKSSFFGFLLIFVMYIFSHKVILRKIESNSKQII
jgi:UDP-GlcNAc:undecaprenyl-phosphate/decaprenyl-phosphate GlcNAc-1-phosphate transferase